MRLSIVVSRIPEGFSELVWEVDEKLFEIIGANYGIEALRCQLRVGVWRDSQVLRLEITVGGEATVPCDRCLQPILLPFSATHWQVYALTYRHLPPAQSEEFYVLGPREDRIDLTQAVYDYICLALPSRRVRPACPDENCPPYVRRFIEIDSSEP